MSPADSLTELLSVWQTRRAEGRTATPEELCRDCPEFAAELRRRIQDIEATERAARASGTAETLPPPDSSLPADSHAVTLPQNPTDFPSPVPEFPSRLGTFDVVGILGQGGMWGVAVIWVSTRSRTCETCCRSCTNWERIRMTNNSLSCSRMPGHAAVRQPSR